MPPNIFLTGATGYIGGEILQALSASHPDYPVTLLVRSEDKASILRKAYPSARIVLGSLDDGEILEKESAAADIVVHTADASDHADAAKSIARGLSKGHTPSRPGYWLHTGGTGILTFSDSRAKRYGESSDKVYDDWENVAELTSLPSDAFHRNVDGIVLKCGTEEADKVKTAIVCPPTIYGAGTGPCATRGRQVYELAKTTLELGKAPLIGEGKARWNNVYVADLAQVYILLIEAATSRKSASEEAELWGARGYYLTENGEHYWGELAALMAKTAAEKGMIKEDKTEKMDVEEAEKVAGFEAVSWGMNSRGKAVRAREVLGWRPKGGSIEAEVPVILEAEQKRLKE